jgi:hypothetical protein
MKPRMAICCIPPTKRTGDASGSPSNLTLIGDADPLLDQCSSAAGFVTLPQDKQKGRGFHRALVIGDGDGLRSPFRPFRRRPAASPA